MSITIGSQISVFCYLTSSTVNILIKKRFPKVLENSVRYRGLAISCLALLGAMFAVPATVWSVFLPSLKQGLPNPIPNWGGILLDIAAFCGWWKWLLVLPL